jgi:uncharacterized protein YjbI with pentapeptide repeats
MSKSPRFAALRVKRDANLFSSVERLCATPDDVARLAHAAAAELNAAFQMRACSHDLCALYRDIYDALWHNRSARDMSYVMSDAALPLTDAFEELAAQPCMNALVLYEMLLGELQCFVAVRALEAGAAPSNAVLHSALCLDFCGITGALLNALADVARGYPLGGPDTIDFSNLSFVGAQFSARCLASLPAPPSFALCDLQRMCIRGAWTGALRLDAPGANLRYASLGAGCVVGDFSDCDLDGTDISALLHSCEGTFFSLPPASAQMVPTFALRDKRTETLTDWPTGVVRAEGALLRHIVCMNNQEQFADLVLRGAES